MITQNQLKNQLNYNPITGFFTWAITKQKVKLGAIAGCLSKSTGYIHLRIYGIEYLAHRLAFLYMTGNFPKNQVDHVNRIKNDNKWLNLRDVTRVGNGRNRPLNKNNTSGVIGVSWNNRRNKWLSYIYLNSKRKDLGFFKSKIVATIKRKQAQKKYGFSERHGII